MQIKPVSRIEPVHPHELTFLDPALLADHASYRTNKRWRGEFAVAAWVRFPEGLDESVELVISYRDRDRRKSYTVDDCRANGQTLILLNGSVTLNVSGEVEDMCLVLKGLSDNAAWILDECLMEPAHWAARRTHAKTRNSNTSSA